ncbi:uncharacterized protein [Rutidosis leptorrhynchoides]|uniref:uncharacterized protein n=1 Tax=Rutidosis leptorrhynchoides TaxID=125765 RepID=UPI003A998D44
MADYIPFHIQQNIMKMLPVESLIRFRLVSKKWKSLIDSSEFIVAHTLTRRTNQQHHIMIRYIDVEEDEIKYVSIVDDDDDDDDDDHDDDDDDDGDDDDDDDDDDGGDGDDGGDDDGDDGDDYDDDDGDDDDDDDDDDEDDDDILQIPTLVGVYDVAGTSHGLLCFFGSDKSGSDIAVILNPSIRACVDVPLPNVIYNEYNERFVRFGVHPNTLDPMIVYMAFNHCFQWQVEVFTLSDGTWRPPLCSSSDVFCETNCFQRYQVVIGKFIYWLSVDTSNENSGNSVVSFDMDTEECTRINLPRCLSYARSPLSDISISKLRDSLAVYDYIGGDFEIWVMEPGIASSFSKLYTCTSPYGDHIRKVLGFGKNGAPIVELEDDTQFRYPCIVVAAVSDPYLKHLSRIGVRGRSRTFDAYFYEETLLLCDY